MGSPNPNPSPSPSTTSKPLPWTHEETVHLIQAYQEKWYSLKRGQLKASNWEEVAVTVSARCGYDHSEPSAKSALQCRHKIEKLRQRYRSESQQQRRHSSWPYFPLMDSLHRGPLPISARPPDTNNISINNNNNSNIVEEEDEDDNDNESDEENIYSSRSRSINYLLRKPTAVNRFAGIADAGKPIRKRHRDFVEEENGGEEEEEEEEEEGRDAVVSALAAEIRKFAERFIGMENMKMEMIKDTERFRMEMENKRMELILDSQKRILDSIHRTFASP